MPEAVASSGDDPLAAGHFTTMQMRGGKVQGRDLHLLRLRQASSDLWDVGTHEGMLLWAIRDGITRAGRRTDCTVRVCVRPVRPGAMDGAPGVPSPFSYGVDDAVDATGFALRVDVELEAPRTVSPTPLRVCSHRGLREHPTLKHLALQAQFAMRAGAEAAGFDDALLVAPDGRIAEGSFWSVAFWDGETVTWPQAPALPGVTWRLLQRALDEAGIPQQRAPVLLGELGGRHAAFAVNSSGIRGIASIDGHALPGDAAFGGTLRALLAAVPWDDL